MNDRVTLGLAVGWLGWLGTFANIFVQHSSAVLSLFCLMLTMVATGYAIMVSRLNIKKMRFESAKIQAELCQECKDGAPPSECPFPEELKPKNCPLLKQHK